ncbi:AAA family ATPase [Geobacillus sp. E263]|jgi:predicted ATPase|uniref:AAA family ATPase n=1 Tax=Geobacillus sp. E263 TaxID=391290 RepID=UPI001179D1CD|nr:AAA family ATPase [Geobacillus sp. E263]
MHRITIENFGPITSFDEKIADLTILIGPQASGKSTISKLIFFFRSIPDELIKYLLSNEKMDKSKNNPFFEFNKELRYKFVGYFGTTKHMKPFNIKYEYSTDKSIRLYLENGYVQINFSENLKKEIFDIFQKVRNLKKEIQNQEKSFIDSWDVSYWKANQKSLLEKTRSAIYSAFEDSKTAIFIPAGRSLVATLSDQLQDINPRQLDLLTEGFIDRINLLKKNFSQSFEEIIQDRKKFSVEKIDFESINLAINIIQQIMKGKYVFSDNGEKIFFNDKEYTKLKFSSSGQQEVVWILLLIFTVILERLNVFMVIEEPEAHLYPTAQKEMVALFSLLLNSSNNTLVITTHSPYILSAFNIYLYAAQISEKLDKGNHPIVDKKLRVSPSKLRAYMVERTEDTFSYKSIVDEELGLIRPEEIDEASNAINDLLDRLMEVEELED